MKQFWTSFKKYFKDDSKDLLAYFGTTCLLWTNVYILTGTIFNEAAEDWFKWTTIMPDVLLVIELIVAIIIVAKGKDEEE